MTEEARPPLEGVVEKIEEGTEKVEQQILTLLTLTPKQLGCVLLLLAAIATAGWGVGTWNTSEKVQSAEFKVQERLNEAGEKLHKSEEANTDIAATKREVDAQRSASSTMSLSFCSRRDATLSNCRGRSPSSSGRAKFFGLPGGTNRHCCGLPKRSSWPKLNPRMAALTRTSSVWTASAPASKIGPVYSGGPSRLQQPRSSKASKWCLATTPRSSVTSSSMIQARSRASGE
jgi:hypothetical protein